VAGGFVFKIFAPKKVAAIMIDFLFPKRLSQWGFLVFAQDKRFLYIPNLASRATNLDADNNLAAQLGDGKEADCKTNRPDCQTDPALFAAPHALTADSKRRLRKFKHI
jgi:hypothetical protein